MVDAPRRVPALAYELKLNGAAQHVESLPGERRLVSHREYRSPSCGSWKKRYVSALPSGFLQPATLSPEPCRIDCGRVVVVDVVLDVASPDGVSAFPPSPPSAPVREADESPDDEFAALLPKTPPKTAARMTMTATIPPTISHGRFLRPWRSGASNSVCWRSDSDTGDLYAVVTVCLSLEK
jgi:hypothetical protein